MATTNGRATGAETATADEGRNVATAARQAAGGVATSIAGAAETVGARLPEAAATTRAAVDEATRRMNAGSDEALTIGTTFSLGMALGLLVGGGNRLLVTIALIPAAAMGLTLLDRGSIRTTRRGGSAG